MKIMLSSGKMLMPEVDGQKRKFGVPCTAKTQSIVENTLAETSCCISAQDENPSGGFFRNRLTGDVAPLHGEQESREPRCLARLEAPGTDG